MTIQMDVQDVVSGNGGNKYCLHFVSPEQGVALEREGLGTLLASYMANYC